MKLRAPMYYKNFKCIADKCSHSCCLAGWEIDIDNETANFYKSVSNNLCNTNTDKFIEKLHKKIELGDEGISHFILNKDGSCPFLNKCGLCDIYINLGEDKLCQICTDHPRFYEWFNDVKEAGIGLCCEEAARLILNQNGKFSTYEIDIPNEECDEYDTEVYQYLCNCRDKIIEYLDCSKREASCTEAGCADVSCAEANYTGASCAEPSCTDIEQRIKDILWYGNMVQLDLESGLLDDEEIIKVETTADDNNYGHCAENCTKSCTENCAENCAENNQTTHSKTFYTQIVEFMCNLEPNSNDWIPYLQECLKLYESSADKMDEFIKYHPEVNTYIKNLAIYFVWRYFLKGVFDGDVICKLKFMCVGVLVAKWLMYCTWLKNNSISLCDCIDIVRRFSEEIEYSDENLEHFFEECFDGEMFEIEELMKML